MSEINLKKLYTQGIVKKGNQNIKVVINRPSGKHFDGHTYMIPLKYLYYNEQNGRIGSSLSKYISENGPVTPGQNELYNQAMQDMIFKNNEKKMNRLVADIGRKGQNQPGYVLNDGRVIDGNRRLTAERILDADPSVGGTQYFEAVILDDLSASDENDQALIKELELRIQFGQMEKEDYDPIDKAIDAYQTVSVRSLMTNQTYAKYADMKPSEVNNLICEAELIVEFLRYLNADETNYALAKEMKLDGPLQDLVPKYKRSIQKSEDKIDILAAIFTKIMQLRLGSDDEDDFKVSLRPLIKDVIGKSAQDKFVDKMQDTIDEVTDAFESDANGQRTSVKNMDDLVRRVSQSNEAQHALVTTKEIVDDAVTDATAKQKQGEPQKLAKQALSKLMNIDTDILNNTNEDNLQELSNLLDSIQQQVTDLKDELE